MTVAVFPLDAVAGEPEYAGRELRDTLAALIGGASSTRPLGAFSGVRPGTPDTTIDLTGTTWTLHPVAGVLDVQAAAEAGPYFWAITADESDALDAASAVNPRRDILSIQLSDPAESDGTSVPGGEIVYTAGSPGAIPVVPPTPARAMKLAEFAVPKTGTGDPTVTWVAPVLYAAGALANVAAVVDLADLPAYNGAWAEVRSTPGALWRYDGADWVMHGIAKFADATARDAAIAAPVSGMRARLATPDAEYEYLGSGWAKYGAPFAASQNARTASSTIVATPAFATLPTTAWTASVTPKVACRAKVTIAAYMASAGGGMEFGFTLSGGVTLAADEFTPGGGSSAAAYGTQNTGLATFSKIVDLPAAATTVTVVARVVGAGGAKSIGAGLLMIEPVMS